MHRKYIHIYYRNILLAEMKLQVSTASEQHIKTLGNNDLMLVHFLAPKTAKFYSRLSSVFCQERKIYFPNINLFSEVYYVQDGTTFICILKIDSFKLLLKSNHYINMTINPLITYMNGIFSSTLPLSKRMEKNQKMFRLFKGSKASSKEGIRKLGLL